MYHTFFEIPFYANKINKQIIELKKKKLTFTILFLFIFYLLFKCIIYNNNI